MRSLIPLLSFLAGCNFQPATVIVGHVAPLSGPDKDSGEQVANGIKLALEDYAAAASADHPLRPIAVRHADNKGELGTAEGQAVRLTSVNHALILLGGTEPAEASRLAKGGALLLSPIGERNKTMSELIIPTGLSPAQRGKALAEFLCDKIKPAEIVLLVEPSDDATAALAAFQAVWDQEKKPAPEKQEFGDAKSDALKAWAANIKEGTLPVIFATPATMTSLALEPSLRDRPLAYAGPELMRRPLADRKAPIYLTTAFGGDGPAAEFAKRYEAKFQTPAEPHSALAYDDARIAFELLKKSPLEFNKLRDDLGSLKEFKGLTGVYTIADGAVHRPAFVGTLSSGTFSSTR